MSVDETIIKKIRETVAAQNETRGGFLRIADALGTISEKAGREVGFNEFWPSYTTVDKIPAADMPSMASALEKETLALEALGEFAQTGITLRDKLELYETAIRMLRLEQSERLDDAITWAQFKTMMSKTIAGMGNPKTKH